MPRAKTIYREPSGRPQRERGISPNEVRRLRDAAIIGLRSAEWGTHLGRLLLLHRLTAEQYAAGVRWREGAAKYGSAIQSPPGARSGNLAGGHSHPADPDTDEGRREAKRHERQVGAFIDAFVALRETGNRGVGVVRSVCETDEAPVGIDGYNALVSGLTRLSDFWGLTNHRKSGNGKSIR